MIHDLDTLDTPTLPAYALCIVGAGPAGITVARELAGSGLRVCVLESGRLRPTKHGDRLRRVLSEGIRIKEYSRERVLGGASTTWSGLSAPLDPIDFIPREARGGAGWPLGRGELLPYYAAAAERYRFPPLPLFEAEEFGRLKAKGDVQPAWHRVEEKIFLAAAVPQNFGREHRQVFEGEGTDLYLDATVTEIEGARSAGGDAPPAVTAVTARTRSGRAFRVPARAFVLAAGGIENARLLLDGKSDPWPRGPGNAHDQVGRFFMNHPKNYHGILRLKRPVRDLPFYFGCLYEGYAGYAGLRLKEAVQEELGCLNSYARFEPLYPWSDDPGVETFVFLAKRCRSLLAVGRRKKEGKVVSLRDYSETGDDTDLQNARKRLRDWAAMPFTVLFHLDKVARYLHARLLSRKAPNVRAVRLRNFMEMEPLPEHRVTLSREKDPFGRPVAKVCHAPTARDKRSLVTLHRVLSEEFDAAGLGTLQSDLHEETIPWPIDLDASHHMGATRMGTDPRRSVVDPDCRVHGTANLYTAGASVFPTSGCANPTFTITALSIRLAEHLKQRKALREEGGDHARA